MAERQWNSCFLEFLKQGTTFMIIFLAPRSLEGPPTVWVGERKYLLLMI
jgi:hypothetical protein